MPTFKQLVKHIQRPLRKNKTRVKDLKKCPQKRGICFKLFIMTPKKPNSAKRKVAKIKLSTKKFVFGYIPGEGNNLQRFSQVLIRGGLIRDLPGVHYTIIRGKLDLHSVYYRRQGRSKYGTKIWWKPKKKDRSGAALVLKKQNIDFIKKKLYQKKVRKYKKIFLQWVVFNLLLLKNKKTKQYLVIPQNLFTKTTLDSSLKKTKKTKQDLLDLKKEAGKRHRKMRKFLLKARRHLLGTDFLQTLRMGGVSSKIKIGEKVSSLQQKRTFSISKKGKIRHGGKSDGNKKKTESSPRKTEVIAKKKQKSKSRTSSSLKLVLNLGKVLSANRLSSTSKKPFLFSRDLKVDLKKGSFLRKDVFTVRKKKENKSFLFNLVTLSRKKPQSQNLKKKIIRFNKINLLLENFSGKTLIPLTKQHRFLWSLQNPISFTTRFSVRYLLSLKRRKQTFSKKFLILNNKILNVLAKQNKIKQHYFIKKLYYSFLMAKKIVFCSLKNYTKVIMLRKSLNLLSLHETKYLNHIAKKIVMFRYNKSLNNFFILQLISFLAVSKIINWFSLINYKNSSYSLLTQSIISENLIFSYTRKSSAILSPSNFCFKSATIKKLSFFNLSISKSNFCLVHPFLKRDQLSLSSKLCVYEKQLCFWGLNLVFNQKKAAYALKIKQQTLVTVPQTLIFFTGLKKHKLKYVADGLHNSLFIDKIFRIFLKKGKKVNIEKIFTQISFFSNHQLQCSFFNVLNLVFQQINLTIELIPMKQAGRILYVPSLLPMLRQLTFALKVLTKGCLLRTEPTIYTRLLNEFLEILLYQKGLTLQKINKLNELAFNSQPNMHYRWKKMLP